MSKDLTAREVITELAVWGGVDGTPDSLAWLERTTDQMNRWLARGDGIAVYTNEDLGHPEVGDKRFVSYGSAIAQLETAEPPPVLPDGLGGTVNYRYQLTGTYRGKALNDPACRADNPDECDGTCRN